MSLAILAIVSGVVGLVIGNEWPRFFPAYKPGTPLVIRESDNSPYTMRVTYVRRRSFTYHRVRVSPGDDLGWAGREITVPTKSILVNVEKEKE